jgi:hypothetical protein
MMSVPPAESGASPGQLDSGGLANALAYVSFPRKYSALTKLKTSPIGAPCPRSRTASSPTDLDDINCWALGPEQFAGERRKICERTRLDAAPDLF